MHGRRYALIAAVSKLPPKELASDEKLYYIGDVDCDGEVGILDVQVIYAVSSL